MLGKLFECKVDKNKKYYRVIQTINEYKDGKKFPIDEVVMADKEIDLNATESIQMGGFCVSTYNCAFRWLIRGDTLCEVIIPEDSKFYKTVSDNDVYVCEKMILTNPKKIDDNLAMELYKVSTLNEISYFRAMTACAICGYINTALKVFEDKVNIQNISVAIPEFEGFCKRRGEEHYGKNILEIESVKIIYNKLKELQNNKKIEQ